MNTIAQTHERLHELVYSDHGKNPLALAFCRVAQTTCDRVSVAKELGEDAWAEQHKLDFVLDVLSRFDRVGLTEHKHMELWIADVLDDDLKVQPNSSIMLRKRCPATEGCTCMEIQPVVTLTVAEAKALAADIFDHLINRNANNYL